MRFAIPLLVFVCALPAHAEPPLPHSIWLEAETFGPLHGGNFSFQQPDKTTKGSWSIAGPDVAQSWTQGGESEFLSVAARADEPGEITIGRDAEVPAAGTYALWVRYTDYRGKKESFGVRIKQGDQVSSHVFGEKPVVDDLDPMKLFWNCAFGWDHVALDLKKGPARIELYTTGPTEARRQVDCLCLTTDSTYHPTGREKPDCAAWRVLRQMRDGGMTHVESLLPKSDAAPADRWKLPAEWQLSAEKPTFLWNVGNQWLDGLAKPGDHIEWPYAFDGALQKEFIATFHDKDLPVYGDPMSGPAIHIPLYPATFANGSPLLEWLDRHPDRKFGILLNYGSPNWPKKDPNKAGHYTNLKKYGDRFIGFVAGEAISNGGLDRKTLDPKIAAAKTRQDVLDALRAAYTEGTIKQYSEYYDQPMTAEQAWEKDIPCLSAGNEIFAHAVMNWGVKRVGHENSGNSPTLARRLAFLRGAARQFHGGIVDYQSCNLGDSSTIFSREGLTYPATSRYILDNQYDAWAGAGINWVLKDYLLFHLAGTGAFYHEEGNDIFWKPAGNSAGDAFPIGLSPRGRVTDAVMSIARSHPRGSQYTPIAFLLDQAHGYSQETFSPGGFGLDPTLNPTLLSAGKHEASIRGWFDVAYYPAPETQNEPCTAIRQTYVNGIFGDIFDVIVTAPNHADIAKTYPVLIAAGEIPLSKEWGESLKAYVEAGGTLVVCEGQFTGPGAAALNLPAAKEEAEALELEWTATKQIVPSNVFKFHAIAAVGAHVLATAGANPIAVSLDRGQGRIIYIAIPMGLGTDERPVPIQPLVLEHLTRGLLPIHVAGDVEWIVNRLDNGNWLLTLLNNRGVNKPQHGVNPTDYREAQTVHIATGFAVKESKEWMAGEQMMWSGKGDNAATEITVPAGVVRMIEITPVR